MTFDDVMPWNCGDKECIAQGGGGWHLAAYSYFEDTGKPCVSNYHDGDWEEIDQEEYPSFREMDEAWLEYYYWMLANDLEDPVRQFNVTREYKRDRRWQFKAHKVWDKRTLVRVRRNGRGSWIQLGEAPDRVREFFGHMQHAWLEGLSEYSLEEFRDSTTVESFQCVRTPLIVKGFAPVEETIPRSSKEIRKELRKMVKDAIKKLEVDDE